MNTIDINTRTYSARIALLMAIVGLAFLYYVGHSMAYSAKRYHRQMQAVEVSCR